MGDEITTDYSFGVDCSFKLYLNKLIYTKPTLNCLCKLTWVQQSALEGRFERSEELLSLIGSFQTKLQVFNGRFGFWEI